MSSIIYAAYPVTGVPIYTDPSQFPVPSIHGALAVAQSNDTLYEFNGTTWVPLSGGGGGGVTSLNALTGALQLTGLGVITVEPASADEINIYYTGISEYFVGTMNGQPPNADGLTIQGDHIYTQEATEEYPGMVSISEQTFAGDKHFTGDIDANNLSGTNTGDVTLGTANGLSILGQALSLATSSSSTTGALTNTDWTAFNNKQAAGNYITALTGDGTASGPGSAALTLATVNSDVGSFGSASAVSAITVNAKGLVTAAASTSIQIAESQVTNLISDLAGKLTTTLASANIFVGNGSNVATAVAMTGDIGISNAGVTAIQAGVIVNNDINASAAIDFSKLAALPSAQILVGSAGNVATATAVTGDISITNGGVTAYAGTVPLNKGGTGQTTKAAAFDALSPMSAGGDLIYGGASGTGTRLANGSAGQVLTSAGGTAAPTWSAISALTVPMSVQRFTSSTGTYNKNYTFIISSATCAAGDTYTNNGVTFTIYQTISSATRLVARGSGPPASSGTLTRTSGSGDATITFSQFIAPLYLKVKMVGGGGGASGGGTSSGVGNGTDGADSTFGTSLLTAAKGTGGTYQGNGGSSGSNTINSPAITIVSVAGGSGQGGALHQTNGSPEGADGGNSVFAGGGGGASYIGGTGFAAATNSGSGGGGGAGGSGSGGTQIGGSGGGAGAYIEALITSPSATYSYGVGTGGSGGSAGGSSGGAGGAGAAGIVIVEEYYQ